MDREYRERNIEDCERKIENCERRLKNVKNSGEDADWLTSELDGYTATLKKLAKSDLIGAPTPGKSTLNSG